MPKSTYLTSLNGRIVKDENAVASVSLSGKTLTVTNGKGESSTYTTVDTTYTDATPSKHGLMSTSDKSKLEGIEENANNYELPSATDTVKGGILVGSGLTINQGTLSITKENVTGVLGYEPASKNIVTTTSDGLMSIADKKKLNAVPEGAFTWGRLANK